MRHLRRILGVAVSITAVAVPYALEDPSVSAAIAHTPWLASTFPVVSGLVYALWRAWRNRNVPAPVASSGAPTMGASS